MEIRKETLGMDVDHIGGSRAEDGMKISFYSSNEEVLKEIGDRIKEARIEKDITQKEMAGRTELSQRTISNLENGRDVSFSTVIEVLRELGELQKLDILLPEGQVRPTEFVAQGKKRERASGRKDEHIDSNWKWGDEA